MKATTARMDDQLGLEPERTTRALYHELLEQR
jgi:hypothetical protein